MKNRITAICLALAAVLLFAAPAAASPTREVDEPVVQAHASGSFNYWGLNVAFGYNYFVQLCDQGWAGSWEQRIIDASTEWNSINGELYFSFAGWSDATCQANWNTGVGKVTRVTMVSNLPEDALAQTTLSFNAFGIYRCDIKIDGDSFYDNFAGLSFNYAWHYTSTGPPPYPKLDVQSVLLHEFGHCVGYHSPGHSTDDEVFVMDNTLGNPTDPRGVENDILWWHDEILYSDKYGDTH